MSKASIGIATSLLTLATMGSTVLGGTAFAGPAGGAAQAGLTIQGATNNCYTIKNGRLVKDDSRCSASATGTNGTSSSGTSGTSSSGTSTPGTTKNNCGGSPNCTASATGTGGKSR